MPRSRRSPDVDLFRPRFPKLGWVGTAYLADDEAEGGAAGEEGEAPDAARLQELLAREIAANKKNRRAKQELGAELKALTESGRVLSEDERDRFRQLAAAEQQRQGENRQATEHYEQLLRQRDATHAEQTAARDATIENLTRLLQQLAGIDQIKSALAGRGVKFVDAAAQLLAENVRVKIVANQPVVEVVDDAGRPWTDAECPAGETISVARLVDQYLATPQGRVWLPPSGDTGTSQHPGAGGGRLDSAMLAELDRDPSRKAEFLRLHGKEAYFEMVSRYGKNRRKQE